MDEWLGWANIYICRQIYVMQGGRERRRREGKKKCLPGGVQIMSCSLYVDQEGGGGREGGTHQAGCI